MKKLLLIFAIPCLVLLGAYFRFAHLESEVPWDVDSNYYAIYIKKCAQVLQVATSSEFQTLFQEYRQKGSHAHFDELFENVKADPRYQALTSEIIPTDQPFPYHGSKPLFILSAALFDFFTHQKYSSLFFTSLTGMLVLLLAWMMCLTTERNISASVILLALLAISPMMIGYSRIGYSNMATNVCLVLALWAYHTSLNKPASLSLLITGFSLGIGIGFHPALTVWIFFFGLYEICTHWKTPKILISRVALLIWGLITAYLILELTLWIIGTISLVSIGRSGKPYLFNFINHSKGGVRYSHFDPFFYIEAITLYEGPIFIFTFALAVFLVIRDRKSLFWVYFSCFPLIFFSIFSQFFFVALRNMVFVLVPAYFLIIQALISRFDSSQTNRKRILFFILIILGLGHSVFSVYTNLDHIQLSVPVGEIKEYVSRANKNWSITDTSGYFLANLYGGKLPFLQTTEKEVLELHRMTQDIFSNPNQKVFDTNIYNKRMFLLEAPQTLPFIFDKKHQAQQSRIIFVANPQTNKGLMP